MNSESSLPVFSKHAPAKASCGCTCSRCYCTEIACSIHNHCCGEECSLTQLFSGEEIWLANETIKRQKLLKRAVIDAFIDWDGNKWGKK